MLLIVIDISIGVFHCHCPIKHMSIIIIESVCEGRSDRAPANNGHMKRGGQVRLVSLLLLLHAHKVVHWTLEAEAETKNSIPHFCQKQKPNCQTANCQ